MKCPSVLQMLMLNADGSKSTVAQIIAEMQASGMSQRCVDRWLQGIESYFERQLRLGNVREEKGGGR